MPDGFDFSAFDHFAADLGRLEHDASGFLRSAVEVTSRRVKDGWNSKLYSAGHARRTRGTISYDITVRGKSIEGEIGPLPTRVQSGIVKLLEVGSIHNPAHGYGGAALHEQEDDFTRGVEKALSDAAAKAGL